MSGLFFGAGICHTEQSGKLGNCEEKMTTSKWVLLVVLAIVSGGSYGSVAQADDQLMILFPQQREKHQNTMDEQAAAYEARGQAFVDHLYATGAEESMPVPEGFMDVSLELGDTVPVNVDEVADIVKESGTSLPAPELSSQ